MSIERMFSRRQKTKRRKSPNVAPRKKIEVFGEPLELKHNRLTKKHVYHIFDQMQPKNSKKWCEFVTPGWLILPDDGGLFERTSDVSDSHKILLGFRRIGEIFNKYLFQF